MYRSPLFLTLLTALLLFPVFSFCQSSKVYVFNLNDEIGPATWRQTRKAFEKATEIKASTIIIRMNTFGGMVEYADSIRSKILNSPMKTVVFIDNNAASAGALISIASDVIYMQKGASIGAASVVDTKGTIMPEKYQSYMRGLMRSTAEAKGRDPKIAEAFVDPDIEIPNLNAKGKVLTLTSKEALKVGYCKAEVTSIDQVFKAEGLDINNRVDHVVTLTDRVIAFLITPFVSGILILLIIGGIYFEMQAPGIGFALLVSIVAAALFFAPLYLEGLAAHWEIGLFIAGIILLMLEVFVIPGFGVAGILGIVFIISGLALSMVLNDFFDFTVTGSEQLTTSLLIVIGSMVGAIVVSVILGKSILNTPVFKRLVLEDEQRSDQGYVTGRKVENLVDKIGITTTDMRPSGKIEIEGKWYDAIAMDGYLDKGTTIYVEKEENYNLFVRKKIL
jgi:membrane-bound serine protease (ClpP class)